MGATKGKSWGFGGTVAVGFGPDITTTYASGGGNFDYNRSKNNGLLTLIDLDGDGLADKVYKKNKRVYYRPQIRISETEFYFGDAVLLDGISDFLLETGDNVDFGLQISVVVLAASGGVPTSKATTTNYFADINGDGRPDLVTKKGVYFNCRDPYTGHISFSTASDLAVPTEPGDESFSAFIFSDNPCDTFFWDGVIDPDLECGNETIWDTTIYVFDHGCVDSASWGKAIRSHGDTTFNIEGCTYSYVGNKDLIFRYCPDIGWDTLEPCRWTPWLSRFQFHQSYENVQIGDYYYSHESGGDVIERHPHYTTQCTNVGIHHDPDIDAVKIWIAPMKGIVQVNSRIRLLLDTSESRVQSRSVDGVAYTVQHSRRIIWNSDFLGGFLDPLHYHAGLFSLQDTNIIYGDIAADDITWHIQNANIMVEKGDVNKGAYIPNVDMLFFDLNSKDNHSFDKVVWQQEITYQDMDYTEDSYGLDKRHYDSESDFMLTGDGYFLAPKSGEVSISGTIMANNLTRPAQVIVSKVAPGLPAIDSVISIPADTVLSHSLEGAGRIVWNVDSGTIICIQAIPVVAGQRPNWSALSFNPVLNFASTFSGIQDTLEYHVPLHYDIDTSQVISLLPNNIILPDHKRRAHQVYHTLFGALYRGWGQFGYNNNTFRFPTHAIRLERLILPRTMLDPPVDTIFTDTDFDYDDIDTNRLTDETYMSDLFESLNLYNPLSDSTSWVQVAPYPKYGAYMSYGNVAFFSRDTMANTRMLDLNFRDSDEEDDDWDIPEYESVIPVSTDGFPVRTIRKQNVSLSGTGSFGVNIPCDDNDDRSSGSLSVSETRGYNRITADCMDMNGDGFPDFLTDKKVQYSMPWGGIGIATYSLDEEICYTQSSSCGSNFGASCLTPKRETKQEYKKNAVMFEGSGSTSANLGEGNDNTTISYMDINGDGLPDMVRDDGNARLNLGYRFSGQENWNHHFIRNGSSITCGHSVGIGGEWFVEHNVPNPLEEAPILEEELNNFDFAQASISGGIGVTHGFSNAEQMLVDVNGDGLPDRVSAHGNNMLVQYNYGKGLWSNTDTIYGSIGQSAFFSESLNTGATAGFTFLGTWKLTFGVQTTPFSRSFSRDHLQLVDINGDGYADLVSSSSENAMSVRYNQAGKTNLLRKVANFCGAYTEMDYTLSVPCYEQPQRQWNLLTVTTGELSSGFPTSQLTTLDSIEYRNPHYNRFERLPYGYDTIIVRQYNTENNNSLYRFTVQGFNNRSFFKRGWKNSESICDADGKMWIEKLYHAILMDWEHPTDTVGEEDCIALAFTSYEAEVTRYYEQETTPQIITEIVRQYDSNHNVIHYENKGDTTHTDEYFSADISYCHGLGHNLISLPDTIVVRDKQNQLLQKRVANYDSLGNLATIEQFWGDSISRYDFYHNVYGSVDSLRMPRNYKGQRMGYTYEYDTVVYTYPARTKDVFGYTSSATYDYRFGKPITTIDLNGNTMKYHYDEWGRLDTLVGPNEVAANIPYTIAMCYHPYLSSGTLNHTDSVSYAVTFHYDQQHPTNPIQTLLLCDGTGRLLQTKKDAEVEGVSQQLNSGRVEYDCFGRTVKQYHPFAHNLTDTAYNNYFDSATLTTSTYDVLDRPLKVVLPTTDSTRTEYGFGTEGDKTYFRTTTIDPNNIAITTLTGTRKQQIKTVAPCNAVTTFTYDPLGQLKTSADSSHYATSYTYDMLGRMIQRVHPDAGTDTYSYDGAGNLLTHTTQVLVNAGETISYYYTYNRQDSIVYPDNPQNNVRYTYGDSTAGNNQRGRISLMEDASGFQTFIYGRMGEVIENNRTFVLPNETHPYSFKMKYTYDSWNRIQDITYPDGEVVHYKYNTGGMLDTVYGTREISNSVNPRGEGLGPVQPEPTTTYIYRYLDHTTYNEFEMKSGQWYGNGTHAQYNYDLLQRLDSLKLYNESGSKLQDIKYNYDAAGNIDSIQNNANFIGLLGGRYLYRYTYDSLYRLSQGLVTIYAPRMTLHDTVRTTYFADGRIASKSQKGRRYLVGSNSTFNVNNTYTYYTDQPHTLKKAGSFTYTWDANGNMLSESIRNTRPARVISELEWDEENRLYHADLPDAGKCAYYQYDASGERFYKNVGTRTILTQNGHSSIYREYDDPVLYASPYVVAKPNGYTKHYFVESERFASRIGDGTITGLNTHATTASVLAAKQAKVNDAAPDSILPNSFNYLCNLPFNWSAHHTTYWQHPDHLGSASWVTDTSGLGYQHLQYMPWGEPLLDQRATTNGYETRYTFSGKERDEETGYSYFGARRYNSALSIWLSVDPMADKYPSTSPYAYCANNPVVLRDSDGEEYILFGDEKSQAATISQIQRQTNLFVYVDNDGYLRVDGKARNRIDRFLQKSCNDESVQVSLVCNNENSFKWSDGTIRGTDCGGGYDGNYLWESAAIARQCVSPSKLAEFDASVGDSKPGLTMIHELAEGYFGGKIALRTGKGSPMAGIKGSTYDRAHKKATQIAWGNKGPVYRHDNIRYNNTTGEIEFGDFNRCIGYKRVP